MVTIRTAEEIRQELLVIRAQAGEESALRELVDTWHKKLVKQAWFQLKSVEGAAEVVQEAWLSIFSSLRKLNDPSAFQAWALQIVRRRAADWIRAQSKQRSKLRSLASSVEPATFLSADPQESSRVERLKAAMDLLPSELRRPIELFYARQLSVADVAKALSLPEGTIKYRLFRARNELRKYLTQGDHDE